MVRNLKKDSVYSGLAVILILKLNFRVKFKGVSLTVLVKESLNWWGGEFSIREAILSIPS